MEVTMSKEIKEIEMLMNKVGRLTDFDDAYRGGDTDYMNKLLDEFREQYPNNLTLQNLGNDEIIDLYDKYCIPDTEIDHTDLDKIERMYNYD